MGFRIGKRRSGGAPVAVSVMVLIGLVLASCGVAGGFLLTKSMIPPTLVSTAKGGTVKPVSSRYDDVRNATVTVSSGAGQSVTSVGAGTVTSSSCTPGMTVRSGSSLYAIDEVGQLMLHTDVPMYRMLESGMSGRDAAALNAELIRLGYAAPNTDTMTWDTIVAYNALVQSVGAKPLTKDTGWAIGPANFVWLSQTSAPIAACTAKVGQSVTSGTELFSTGSTPTSAAVSLPNTQVVAGDRVIVVGDKRFDMPADVTEITDKGELDAIMSSNEYLVAKTQAGMATGDGTASNGMSDATGGSGGAAGSLSVTFTWVLKTPLDVWEVPPSALYNVTGDTGCVASDGKPMPVTIIASELGKTKITVDTDSLGRIDIAPGDDATPCR
ncbi:hypothetical protein JS533_000595 [Bifidobacterium amazonense]|uniref:Peptidoglycan-binding protein n=1 Tax=Bifidobacterium amazonense TaxID=2809027 RepID=A0ABS9VRQ6_9BIFI|nr:hypothetical protein [Bifidobacterium amazonense]MCH9274793.1 hypothetical protein [Bifidobacterium amazonense]